MIKREQRILTDHVGRLSQAVMELKTSKRSDALAAAAQIRDQAEETMTNIRQEMQSMRKGNTEYVNNMESRLSLVENNVQASIHEFRNEYDMKIKDLKIEAESGIDSIKRELESTLLAVKRDLVFNHNGRGTTKYNSSSSKTTNDHAFDRIDVGEMDVNALPSFANGNDGINHSSPSRRSVGNRSGSTPINMASPLRATSIRTIALDNELKLLEEKIKHAQESILSGYELQ